MSEHEEIGFLPPQNLEAERHLLSSVIMDPKASVDLRPQDFYSPAHCEIYRTALGLKNDGKPVDVVTLTSNPKIDKGLVFTLAENFITSANNKYHAKMILECSLKRNLVQICRETIDRVHFDCIDDILTALRAKTGGLITGYGCEIVTMREVAQETLNAVEHRYENKGCVAGIRSGICEIDEITDGWQKGDMIVLAARPGMGKSALAMQFAQDSGVECGFISLEMGRNQIGIRALSHLSGVELWKMRKGHLGREDWPWLTQGAVKMAEMPISFTFKAQKISEIERTITEMVEKNNIKLLLVDYLQRASVNEPKKREQEVAEISRYFKGVALVRDIPVIALAQLNRKVEDRAEKKPTLADLRESGQIEQDADIVMFLSGDYKQGNGEATLTFAKGRNIGLGEVKLYFNGDIQKFKSIKEVEE